MTSNPAARTTNKCGFTVLRTTGKKIATKQWDWNPHRGEWTKKSYGAGTRFTASEHSFANLRELVAILEHVRADATAFVVRGALAPDVAAAIAENPQHLIRRLKNPQGGTPASLVETSRRWVMIDIDKWRMPEWADLAVDPESVIEMAIYALLPEAFQDVECWWHLSSSAGFVPGILKAHLFFWLTKPVPDAVIKDSLRYHAPEIDLAPFDAVQSHFVADPVINGRPDPITRRTGWRKGLDEAVTLPPAPHRTKTSANTLQRALCADLSQLGRGFEGAAGFHVPLRTEIMRYARMCSDNPHLRDYERLKKKLYTAILAAPNDGGSIQQYLSEEYLSRSIAGAFSMAANTSSLSPVDPFYPAPSLPPADAAHEVLVQCRRAFDNFFDHWATVKKINERSSQQDISRRLFPDLDSIFSPQPPQKAIAVGTGLGKSVSAIEAIAAFVRRSKEAGQPYRGAYFVPFMALAEDIAAKLRKAGTYAETWRGIEQVDLRSIPDAAGVRQTMCRDLDLAHAVTKSGGDIKRDACGDGEGRTVCPFVSTCGWRDQHGRVAKADVVLLANTMMFSQLPKVISKGLAFTVCDEAFFSQGLKTYELDVGSFVDEIRTQWVLKANQQHGQRRVRDDEAQNDLLHLASEVQKMVQSMSGGSRWVDPKLALSLNLTEERCKLAHDHEQNRRRRGDVFNGQSQTERIKAIAESRLNSTVTPRAAFWRELGNIVSGKKSSEGRIEIARRERKDGTSYTAILVHCRKEVVKNIYAAPVLVMDATMVPEINRLFFPHLEVVADLQAQLPPDVYVRQILTGTGSTTLVRRNDILGEVLGDEEATKRAVTAKTRKNKVADIADRCAAVAQGNGLLISYMGLEEELKRPGVHVTHWNAFAGLDTYGDVAAIAVVGRPLPSPDELREMAIQLTGERLEPEEPILVTRGIRMADGTGYPVETRRYAHPTLDMLQTAITDAAVEQAYGRARAVWRDKTRPLVIEIYGDTVTRLVVNEVITGTDWKLTDEDRMVSAGMVLTNPTDAFVAFGLWPSVDATKKALDRNPGFKLRWGGRGEGHSPKNIISHRRMSPTSLAHTTDWVCVTYQLAGVGKRRATACVNLGLIPTPADWLSDKLGQLVFCEVAVCKTESSAFVQPSNILPAPVAHLAERQREQVRVDGADEASPDKPLQFAHSRALGPTGTVQLDYVTEQEPLSPGMFYKRGALEIPPETMLRHTWANGNEWELEFPAFGPYVGLTLVTPDFISPPALLHRCKVISRCNQISI